MKLVDSNVWLTLTLSKHVFHVATRAWLKAETRLVRPGERLTLPHAFPIDRVEEMRSLEIERQHDCPPERGQRLGRTETRSNVVPPRPRVDERLVAEGLYEIESRCRGSRGNPWSCDY